MVVGLLHPGEMGAAVAAQLVSRGIPVLWASEGRSRETARRAEAFEDVGTADALAARSDVILSICPPHAAHEVAGSVAGFEGIYVDANAIAPATAREVLDAFVRGVDGGIVGGPSGASSLPLGARRARRRGAVRGHRSRSRASYRTEIGAASAVKVTFAAWTKGTAAMLLAILELARAEGVEDALLAEWEESLPELLPGGSRAPVAPPTRRAGAGSARWRRSPRRSPRTVFPTGSTEAAAEVFGWPQGVRS